MAKNRNLFLPKRSIYMFNSLPFVLEFSKLKYDNYVGL